VDEALKWDAMNLMTMQFTFSIELLQCRLHTQFHRNDSFPLSRCHHHLNVDETNMLIKIFWIITLTLQYSNYVGFPISNQINEFFPPPPLKIFTRVDVRVCFWSYEFIIGELLRNINLCRRRGATKKNVSDIFVTLNIP
jgi:hypothetical protein